MTPFEALYGRPPPLLTGYVPGESKVASVDDLLTQHAMNLKLIKENLVGARNRMVQQANKKHTDKTLEENDWVYLKLQPYRQLSLKHHRSQKLAKRFYGPFRIIRRIGAVAYELDLPSSARVHPVFHVSLLKSCYGAPDTQIVPLPEVLFPPSSLVPLQILRRRYRNVGHSRKEELLVQWTNQTLDDATWELKDVFVSSFAQFDLEDKIPFDTESDVTNALLGKNVLGQQEVMGEDDASTENASNNFGPNLKAKRTRKEPSWLKGFAK